MPRLDIFPEDHMQYAYGIYLFKASHPLVRRLKRVAKPSVYGHRAWSSSYLLMDWFQQYPLEPKSRVLEIGCGWGPAAVFCASQQQAKVTALDIDDSVFPYLDMLAQANDARVRPLHASFTELSVAQLAKYDVIIGADVCFWEDMVEAMLLLIQRAKSAGVKQLVLADPGRSTFARLCDLCEEQWPESFQHEYWYSLQPNRYEGQLLIMHLNAA